MRISVVGTGYVGLVTGACLAHVGHDVTCMDVDGSKIRRLNEGQMPIYEPGLEELVAEGRAEGRLHFVHGYDAAVPGAEAIFICVGTPALPDGRSDTSAVGAAARSLGEHLGPDYCVIINKSTVPIGSGDWVGMLVREGMRGRNGWENGRVSDGATSERRGEITASETGSGPVDEDSLELSVSGRKGGSAGSVALASSTRRYVSHSPTRPVPYAPAFDVVSNPEFLREGTAIADASFPDRIVIGAESPRAVERMEALYAPLIARNAARGREVPFVVTDRASAELIKYAANAFLATKISFINEVANICERVGADVQEVARGIGMDARIGSNFLSAGIGWGGSCFPKDLASLVETAREYGYEAELLRSVGAVNRAQRGVAIRKLQERLKLIKGKTIALWGLAFKPGTDDMRDAPAIEIAGRLAELGAAVRAYDPQAMEVARRCHLPVQLCADPYEAAEDASAIVLVTEWPEFEMIDWARLRRIVRRPLIVDGRNALDPAPLLWHGFEVLWDRPVNVLLAATDFPPTTGGIQTMLGALAAELSDWRLTVLAPMEDGCLEFDRAQRYRVVRARRLGSRPGAKGALPGMTAGLLSLALKERPDLLLCAHPVDSLLAPFLKHTLGLPYVVITYCRELFSPRLRPWLPRLLGGAERVITISRYAQRRVTSFGVPEERVALLPLGYDPGRFEGYLAVGPPPPSDLTRRLGLSRAPWLLTVSRLADRYKGIDTVLQAMPSILREVPDCRYVIAGDGRLRPELEQMAERLQCRERVLFLGRVSNADLKALYQECAAFTLMSRDSPIDGGVEGFGLVFLEAGSFGKPVLGGNSGGIPDAVIDGVTGLLANPCDPSDVARKAIRLLTDPDLAGRLGRQGQEWVHRERTWTACAAELQRILYECRPKRHISVRGQHSSLEG